MKDQIYIHLSRKALSGLVMIFAGLLAVQTWWIGYNGATADEIREIVKTETGPIASRVDQVHEYSEIQYIALKNYDARLAVVESTHAAIYKAVREEGQQTRQSTSKIDRIGEMITRYMAPDTISTVKLENNDPDPIQPIQEIDTNELNRVRNNKSPYRKRLRP